MSRPGTKSTFSAVLLAAVALASCAKSAHDEHERYVFVASNINLPYWEEAAAGFRDAAKALGIEVKGEMIGPEKYDPSAEIGMFRDVVAQHPAGICLSAARPELFKDEIDKAIAQGIPVVCVDSDVPESKRVMYIGTDNFRAGRESLRRMGTLLKNRGDIYVISIPGQHNLDDRVAGAADALKNYPALKIVKIIDDEGDGRVAFDRISELIQKKEKVDGIICLEATGGPGAAAAIHRFNMDGKIPVVAFDKDPETLDWIDRGVITATIAQKPYVMSYYGLKFLDDLHHNAVREFKDWQTAPAAPLPTSIDTGTAVVDKGNLAKFREALAAHPKPL